MMDYLPASTFESHRFHGDAAEAKTDLQVCWGSAPDTYHVRVAWRVWVEHAVAT